MSSSDSEAASLSVFATTLEGPWNQMHASSFLHTWFIYNLNQRWASATLVRTSAIPQYCRQPNWLRNCGLKKVAEMRLRTFKIGLTQFRNSLPSMSSFTSFQSLLLSSGWFYKATNNNFYNRLFLWKTKTCLKRTVTRDFSFPIFVQNRPHMDRDSHPNFFLNSTSNSRRYSNSKFVPWLGDSLNMDHFRLGYCNFYM
jgi:hypothetical protein